MKREQIVFIIAMLLQVLFLYAAVSKVADMEKFRTEIGQSPLLTYFVQPIAIGVPAFEIAIVVLLYFATTRLMGLYLSFFLMTLFTAYVVAIMRFASYVPCSCGGILSEMNWQQHLTFNIVHTVLALVGVLLTETNAFSIHKHKKVKPAT